VVDKRARVREQIPTGKRAVVVQSVRDDDSVRVSWRLGDADLNGRWRWTVHNITPAHALEILGFMAEMDKLTWAQAQQGWRPKAKRVETAGICAEAQGRLAHLALDDLEHLEEWHMGGAERIWGFRVGHICHVLWWDADHSVWPSEPD
jgi:hypothetical protein